MIRFTVKELKNLWLCKRAVAAIEFALGLPVILFLLLGGVELANFALAHYRVGLIASTVADDTGRGLMGIDEYNIAEAFGGAELIGEGIRFRQNGRIILSSLEPNAANNGQWIRWQRCFGQLNVTHRYGAQGKGQFDTSLSDGMGAGTQKAKASANTALMFVEASYRYQPIALTSLLENRIIRYESAFNVRGRKDQNITNNNGITAFECVY